MWYCSYISKRISRNEDLSHSSCTFGPKSCNQPMDNRFITECCIRVSRVQDRRVFHIAFGRWCHIQKRAWACRHLAGFAYTRLRLRRPHEPLSRPQGRPSPVAVEAGGHGSRRIQRKGTSRVDRRASKRGEHKECQSCGEAILSILNIYRYIYR